MKTPASARRAKIVATFGPSSSSPEMIARLIRSGVNVVRLNLSHGTRDEHRELVRRVRRVADEERQFVAIMIDLMGPRYRLGQMDGEVMLRRGRRVTMGRAGANVDLPLDDGSILRHLAKGERILLDNGLIAARVVAKERGRVVLKVSSEGPVSSRKGINLPDSKLPFRISDKDDADLAMAVEENADYVAASYVGEARDVVKVRKALQAHGGDIPIVAKLERGRAIENLDAIVDASDAVMVARGDLGVEVPLHEVPILQKRIVDLGWRKSKPVIVATQMLESMMQNPRPTRAETSDVANAIYDGADAVMLSGETAAGRYPVEVVETMARIVVEAEHHRLETDSSEAARSGGALRAFDLEPPVRPGTLEISETISAAAVLAARQLGARYIVALTQGGFTVRMLAARRPSTSVVALTQNRQSARRLQLVWGIVPIFMSGEVHHHDEVVRLVDDHLLDAKLADPGDRIALLMGDPIQSRPPTNLLRLHTVRNREGASEARSSAKTQARKRSAPKKAVEKKAKQRRTAKKKTARKRSAAKAASSRTKGKSK